MQNVYSYGYQNLVIAYGLAIFFTLLCVLLGWSAYLSNGMSYDFTVSSIISTSQNPDVSLSLITSSPPPPLSAKAKQTNTPLISSSHLRSLYTSFATKRWVRCHWIHRSAKPSYDSATWSPSSARIPPGSLFGALHSDLKALFPSSRRISS